MPVVGFGTGGLEGSAGRETIRKALDAGYRRFDTAEGYGNEETVGEGVAKHDRDDLFLASKVLPKNLHYESVLDSCEASLDRLGTDYFDLYLVHRPNPAISLRETLDAFERLREKARSGPSASRTSRPTG